MMAKMAMAIINSIRVSPAFLTGGLNAHMEKTINGGVIVFFPVDLFACADHQRLDFFVRRIDNLNPHNPFPALILCGTAKEDFFLFFFLLGVLLAIHWARVRFFSESRLRTLFCTADINADIATAKMARATMTSIRVNPSDFFIVAYP
jgi:hypothetical protein